MDDGEYYPGEGELHQKRDKLDQTETQLEALKTQDVLVFFLFEGEAGKGKTPYSITSSPGELQFREGRARLDSNWGWGRFNREEKTMWEVKEKSWGGVKFFKTETVQKKQKQGGSPSVGQEKGISKRDGVTEHQGNTHGGRGQRWKLWGLSHGGENRFISRIT